MYLSELSFLVVEDHEFQRAVLLKILSDLGVTQVAVAADGHSALKIIGAPEQPIDIIISDLDMPGMDGMEFIRHLSEEAVPISIILASGLETALLSSIETMARDYGVRILGVIEKPVTPAELGALIARYRPTLPKSSQQGRAAPSFRLAEIVAGLNNDEFQPYFQPKVSLATGEVRGAEALARWCHPQHGVIAPSAFIGLMEAHGLIDALTWIMLRKSAAFCRQWREASGLEITVAVNLSMKSLANPTIADQVMSLVASESLEPKCMVLEVTESALSANVGMALENLSRLRMKGFGLSIDDYGTGYSSMQQLTRIAFTELKIDQSFVAGAERQQSARIILQSSLEMAKKLAITSVAEGVETKEHWDLLRQLGCQVAQGYFIAEPMAAPAFLQWHADTLA